MTRDEHLLNQLSEECAEVAQRVSKLLRFGPDEIQPGQELTNRERLELEMKDLNATAEMCLDQGLLTNYKPDQNYVKMRRYRFDEYLRYSKTCGTVAEPKQ